MRSCLLGATNSSELITRGPFRPFPSLFRMWSGLAPRYANRANLPHVGLESLQLRQDEREHRATPEVRYGEYAPTCSYLYQHYPTGASPRFVLTKFAGDMAFDLQTGQTCRTWDWTPTTPGKLDANRNAPEVKYGEFTPTCVISTSLGESPD